MIVWRVYLQLARNANAKGDVEGAIRHFDRMLFWRPNLHARVLYGYYLLKIGRVDKAQYVFDNYVMCDKKVLRQKMKDGLRVINKKEMFAKNNYALLLWKQGKLSEAIEMLEYVYLQYKNTLVFCNLGYLYLLNGELAKALKFNRKAYDFAPDNNVILDNLGCTYLHLGELEQAEELYGQMMAKEPDKLPKFPEAYYDYGLVKEQQGESKAAAALFERALQFSFHHLSNVTEDQVKEALERVRKQAGTGN